MSSGFADAAESEWNYRIARGDTLIALTEAYLQPERSWQQLQQFNRIDHPRRLLPGSTLRIPVAWLRSSSITAEIIHVHGQTEVLQPGDAGPSRGRAGLILRSGAVLRTAESASVVVRFADGSRLLVAPSTQVSLERLATYGRSGLRSTELKLERGNVESQVVPAAQTSPAYQITTPTATLGVRGTEFRARAEGERSSVEVLSGAVAAEAEREVRVEAGFGTVVDRVRGVAAPRPLLPAPVLAAPGTTNAGAPIDLRWATVAGAQAYRSQLLDGTGAIWIDSVGRELQARWPVPQAGVFTVRVRAIDEAGLEGRDAQLVLAMGAALPPARLTPPPPQATQPTRGARVRGDSIAFAWLALEAGRRYRLQVADGPDFKRIVADLADDAAAPYGLVQRSVTLPPGRYHWRIAALSADGVAGPFGEASEVELEAAGP